MKLTVIIPAYNEEKTIARILEKVFAVDLPVEREVIVVDAASSDRTAEAVEQTGFPVRLVRLIRKSGKGTAVRRGIAVSSGDAVLIQDADCEYDPRDYPALLEPLINGRAAVIYGSRVLKKDNRYSYFWAYFGGRVLSWWTNLLFGSHITDEATGYKLFDARLIRSLGLRCRGFEFCPEVTAKVLRRGVKIVEVPISYYPRSKAEGKKINVWDGLFALWTLLRLRFRE
jgi:glycosyltransferase involved in cell wall biosynthesis